MICQKAPVIAVPAVVHFDACIVVLFIEPLIVGHYSIVILYRLIGLVYSLYLFWVSRTSVFYIIFLVIYNQQV